MKNLHIYKKPGPIGSKLHKIEYVNKIKEVPEKPRILLYHNPMIKNQTFNMLFDLNLDISFIF